MFACESYDDRFALAGPGPMGDSTVPDRPWKSPYVLLSELATGNIQGNITITCRVHPSNLVLEHVGYFQYFF